MGSELLLAVGYVLIGVLLLIASLVLYVRTRSWEAGIIAAGHLLCGLVTPGLRLLATTGIWNIEPDSGSAIATSVVGDVGIVLVIVGLLLLVSNRLPKKAAS